MKSRGTICKHCETPNVVTKSHMADTHEMKKISLFYKFIHVIENCQSNGPSCKTYGSNEFIFKANANFPITASTAP